ncbi:MAG: hypothetical protein WEB00_11660 [Dehalococcoidia bacterium]
MAETTPERLGRAFIASINLIFAALVAVVAAVVYWQWQNDYARIQDESWFFRAMWAGLIALGAGGIVWVVLQSVRPSRQQ